MLKKPRLLASSVRRIFPNTTRPSYAITNVASIFYSKRYTRPSRRTQIAPHSVLLYWLFLIRVRRVASIDRRIRPLYSNGSRSYLDASRRERSWRMFVDSFVAYFEYLRFCSLKQNLPWECYSTGLATSTESQIISHFNFSSYPHIIFLSSLYLPHTFVTYVVPVYFI